MYANGCVVGGLPLVVCETVFSYGISNYIILLGILYSTSASTLHPDWLADHSYLQTCGFNSDVRVLEHKLLSNLSPKTLAMMVGQLVAVVIARRPAKHIENLGSPGSLWDRE